MRKKKMTWKEFLKELEKHKGKFVLLPNGMLRKKRTSQCPLEAVGHVRYGRPRASFCKLNLAGVRLSAVMVAADVPRYFSPEKKLRRDMLKALGLKEKRHA